MPPESPSSQNPGAASSLSAQARPDPLGTSETQQVTQSPPPAASSSAGPVSGLAGFSQVGQGRGSPGNNPGPALSSSAAAIQP